MPKIITLSGQLWDQADPIPRELLEPWTLAKLLHAQSRWSGHTMRRYSVCEHSLLVWLHVPEELDLGLPALLHDAHEAFTGYGDVPEQLKPESLRQREEQLDAQIASHYGFDPALFRHEAIVRADRKLARAVELRRLFPQTPVVQALVQELDPDGETAYRHLCTQHQGPAREAYRRGLESYLRKNRHDTQA